MKDVIPLSEACRDVLEDLGQARHPTSRRPWLSMPSTENGRGEPGEEPGSPLPAVDLIVG